MKPVHIYNLLTAPRVSVYTQHDIAHNRASYNLDSDLDVLAATVLCLLNIISYPVSSKTMINTSHKVAPPPLELLKLPTHLVFPRLLDAHGHVGYVFWPGGWPQQLLQYLLDLHHFQNRFTWNGGLDDGVKKRVGWVEFKCLRKLTGCAKLRGAVVLRGHTSMEELKKVGKTIEGRAGITDDGNQTPIEALRAFNCSWFFQGWYLYQYIQVSGLML